MLQILVTGHSWVRDMQDVFVPALLPGMEVVFRAYPGINLERLQQRMIQILDATYTHLVVYILINEAYRQQVVSDSPGDREHWVTVANFGYDNNQFCHRFTEFSRACTRICPNLRIVLIIPPFLDLVYYNSIRVRRFPREIREMYERRPEFSDRILHQQCVSTHRHLRVLRTQRFQWVNKTTYPVMYAVAALPRQKRNTRLFMEGSVLTLRNGGFLRDGLHPMAQLCSDFWRRMYHAGVFNLIVEVPRVESSIVNVSPYMSLDIRQDPPSGIGGVSNSRIVEVSENMEEPQAGPSREESRVVVVEEVDLVEDEAENVVGGREENVEEERVEGVVEERAENIVEGRVENVVEERMEIVQEGAFAVEERPVLVGNPPEREVPIGILERLSLEEEPQGASQRRSHSPIRYDRRTSPEASGSSVRPRVDRQRSNERSRGRRYNPYGRSQSNVTEQRRRDDNRSRSVQRSLEEQWEIKFGEFIAHMQGFMAAHGQETSSRDIKNRIRRLCNQ